MIASVERIAVEIKEFGGLGTKNGSYRSVPKDSVSRSGGLAFQNLDFECIKPNFEREQDFFAARMKAKLRNMERSLLLELPNIDEYRENILGFLWTKEDRGVFRLSLTKLIESPDASKQVEKFVVWLKAFVCRTTCVPLCWRTY